LFVGAEFERKGGKLLLRWVNETARGDFRVDIVTKEPVDPSPRVTVHSGFAPNQPGLIDLIRRADLLVLPTRADMSPWVIAEAKAAGTAVISTRVGAIPELIRDGVDGWLVSPDDYANFAHRLEEALGDRQKLFDFGRRAREDALERFNSVTNARKLIEFMINRI
jgi:glycosyltransferase involved in cell wall biosynthesis